MADGMPAWLRNAGPARREVRLHVGPARGQAVELSMTDVISGDAIEVTLAGADYHGFVNALATAYRAQP